MHIGVGIFNLSAHLLPASSRMLSGHVVEHDCQFPACTFPKGNYGGSTQYSQLSKHSLNTYCWYLLHVNVTRYLMCFARDMQDTKGTHKRRLTQSSRIKIF